MKETLTEPLLEILKTEWASKPTLESLIRSLKEYNWKQYKIELPARPQNAIWRLGICGYNREMVDHAAIGNLEVVYPGLVLFNPACDLYKRYASLFHVGSLGGNQIVGISLMQTDFFNQMIGIERNDGAMLVKLTDCYGLGKHEVIEIDQNSQKLIERFIDFWILGRDCPSFVL